MKAILTLASAAAFAGLLSGSAIAGPTLDLIKKNDYVRCGVASSGGWLPQHHASGGARHFAGDDIGLSSWHSSAIKKLARRACRGNLR